MKLTHTRFNNRMSVHPGQLVQTCGARLNGEVKDQRTYKYVRCVGVVLTIEPPRVRGASRRTYVVSDNHVYVFSHYDLRVCDDPE